MTSPVEPHALMLGAEWFTDLPGGLNRYVAGLAEALGAEGTPARVVVIGPAVGAPGPVVAVSSLRQPFLRRAMAVRRAAKIAGSGASVVDAHFAAYAFLPLLTTRLRALPLVVHFQGPWADESGVERGHGRLKRAVKRCIERAVYRRADRLIVLSNDFATVLVQRYGVDPTRVEVIPPGVDLVRFTTGDAATARAGLGIPEGAFVVATVRRLEARMGVDTLIAAWRIAQAEIPGAVLLVVGDGADRARLEKLARELPHPEQVRFLGRLPDTELVGVFQAADCSVVPSAAFEGFGLVVLESLACGTPAVVSDVGGLPEAVADLDNSLVIPARDAAALAARLVSAAKGHLPQRDTCRSYAERFDWREVARRHVRVYTDVSDYRVRRKRVVFVDHCAQLSGGELALARLLPALDVDAHVILAEDGPLVDLLRAAGARVEILPMSVTTRAFHREQVGTGRSAGAALDALVYSLRLARRLRALRADLVHTNSLKAALYGGLAGRLARVPVVWHIRDRIDDDYLSRTGRRITRAAARVAPSAVIANSATTMATLRLPPSTRSYTIASPVEVPRDLPLRRAITQPLVVGMVGRLAPWKGQHLFLEAFARAFGDGDELAVVVGGALFGEEVYAADLCSQARRLGIDGRVVFRGHVLDVAAEYAKLDIAVHASLTPEPFGQVVVEAFAFGVPIVAANAGGPAEVVDDGVDGLLFPPGDIDGLAARLSQLAGDESLRASLAANGRRKATGFTPDVLGDRVAAVYGDLLGSR